MPEPVKRAVITKVNLTRQGPGGRRWQPGKDAVICNVHYKDHQGPSCDNRNLVPVHFKRPSQGMVKKHLFHANKSHAVYPLSANICCPGCKTSSNPLCSTVCLSTTIS